MENETKIFKVRNSVENNTDIELWAEKLEEKCVTDITNKDILIGSLEVAKAKQIPLPLIITLCPAVFNLEFPTAKGQTREFVKIDNENTRVHSFFEEVFGFQALLKKESKLDTELFIIFGDLPEKGADRMTVNVTELKDITLESMQSIKSILSDIDSSSNGMFQREKIKIPKIRLQSNISQQGGKIDLNREFLIQSFEREILDPNSPFFNLWVKHVQFARNDSKFTETSWQGIKSAEAIWTRMRFLIAELTTDGVFLPEIMKHITNKSDIEPVFLASSVRPATLEMEADCFNMKKQRVLIPAFRNIGKWLEPPESSPWIDELRNV